MIGLGIGIPFSFIRHVESGGFDPRVIASITGLWEDAYGGSPWLGEVGGRDLADAGAPAVGAALNGLATSDYDGSGLTSLSAAVNASVLFNASAGGFWVLFQADVADAPAALPLDRAVMSMKSFGYIGAGINSDGFRPWINDGGYKGVTVATGTPTGAWLLGQAKWNGTNLYARLGRGSWDSVACGPIGYLDSAINLGGWFASFNGRIANFATMNGFEDDSVFDNVCDYVEDRYALSL